MYLCYNAVVYWYLGVFSPEDLPTVSKRLQSGFPEGDPAHCIRSFVALPSVINSCEFKTYSIEYNLN